MPLSFGPIPSGSVTFSLYWMLLGVTLAVLGLQSFFFGVLAQVLCDYSGQSRRRWTGIFRYTRSVLSSFAVFVVGLASCSGPGVYYLAGGTSCRAPAPRQPTIWP